MAATLSTLFALFSALAIAQNTSAICSWQAARAGVVRDALYIEGGILTLKESMSSSSGDCHTSPGRYGTLYKLNFSKSFDVATDNPMALLDYIEETKDSAAPTYVGGAMFADNDEWYTYGGAAFPVVATTGKAEGIVWGGVYQPNELATSAGVGGISSTYQPLDNITKYVTWGAGVSVPSESLGFYFGGFKNINGSAISSQPFSNGSDAFDTTVDTMLSVDTQHYNQAGWTETKLPDTVEPRAGASLVWLPVGSRGALAVIGGVAYPAVFRNGLNDSMESENEEKNPLYTVNIPIYDIGNGKWYVQETATDSTPPAAFAQACAVVASSQDGSSHQIYIYGGWDGNGAAPAFDDVWILSLPGFVWIRATPGQNQHGRFAHACATPYPNQMFAVGGVSQSYGIITDGKILDVYDLNTLTWTGKYDPTVWSAYKVPGIVVDKIGGNENGSSTLFAAGMNAELKSLFNTPYGGDIRNWYPYTKAVVPATPSSKPSWMVPVIVTIAVLVGLTVIAAVVWFCWYTPRRRKQQVGSQAEVTETPSQGFMASWLRQNANNQYPPPKSVVSEDVTEIGTETTSPRYEVPGFTFYKPQRHEPNQPVEVGGEPLPGHTRLYSASTSPTSSTPGSPFPSEIETPPLFDRARSNYPLREHHMYPHPLDGISTVGSISAASNSGRYANARPPNTSTVNPMFPYELASNQSRTDLGQTLKPPTNTRLNNARSVTDSSASISEATDADSQAHMATAVEVQVLRTPPLQGSAKAFTGPPTALSTRNTHQRNTSSQNSIPFTLSPTTPDNYGNSVPVGPSVSPGEEKRRSEHINSLPDRSAAMPKRNVTALAESEHEVQATLQAQPQTQIEHESLTRDDDRKTNAVRQEVRRIESREQVPQPVSPSDAVGNVLETTSSAYQSNNDRLGLSGDRDNVPGETGNNVI